MKTYLKSSSCAAFLAAAAGLLFGAIPAAEASQSLAFCKNETPGGTPNGDYVIDYNAYVSNPAQFLAFSPKVSLKGASVLKFKVLVGDEWDQGQGVADQLSVWASLDGSHIGYNILASSAPSLGGALIAEWHHFGYVEVTVDLTGYANKDINLAFCFDPLDDQFNSYAGVRVEDVVVTDGTETLYEETFEDGLAQGWQLSGLWHVASDPALSLPAVWLTTNSLPGTTNLLDDPNGDGVNLLLAYALGLNPRLNLSGSLPKAEVAGGKLSLQYYAGTPGIVYRTETSTGLSGWTTSGLTLSSPASNQIRTVSIDANEVKRYLRLMVTQ